MKPFQEIQPSDLDALFLRNQIRKNGYVLLRDLLPRVAVRSVLSDVTQVLYEAGWLQPDNDPLKRMANNDAACGDPDPVFKQVYQEIFNLESFHALPHQAALQRVMKMLVGDKLLVHPKPIGRLIFPNCERLVVHAHQDYEFMGGDPEFFTVWIPLHDCPITIGPLKILAGSHRLGPRYHERENLHVPEIPAKTTMTEEWVGGPIDAGDVLIFHSLTVHAASPNLSNQLRISLDCRFQDAARVINPANLVFSGESGKSWEKTYAGWQSNDLKFYWKKLPLTLQPTKKEIEQLAQSSDSPSLRARYARMMSQLV